MTNEVINLNLIPDCEIEIPSFHTAQYDNKRTLAFRLFNGESEYELPEGYSITVNERKVDGKIVMLTPHASVGNLLMFRTTEQFCACPGENICTVTITDENDLEVTSLYFKNIVQRSVLYGAMQSESEIDNLQEQINKMVTESVESIAPGIVEDIATPIVDVEVRNRVNELAGSWFSFDVYIDYEEQQITIPKLNDDCIITDICCSDSGVSITGIEVVHFTATSGTIKVKYKGLTSSTAKMYLRFFDSNYL